jgi:hypothetical protein
MPRGLEFSFEQSAEAARLFGIKRVALPDGGFK